MTSRIEHDLLGKPELTHQPLHGAAGHRDALRLSASHTFRAP
jgi:hypothetical protein